MIDGTPIAALCMSRLHDTENCRFIANLNERLVESGCSLWIYNINTDMYWNDEHPRAEAAVFDLIDYEKTDVIILMDEKIKSHEIAGRILKRAREHNVPVIVVDGSYEGTVCVRYDYTRGFEQVCRHVIEYHQAKHPHFMGGFAENPFSMERQEVFRRVCEENGIRYDEKTMVSYGNFWAKPAKAATEAIIASGNIPDAIICANDIMAINVASVLFEHGIRVPEDVIVTGFDGIDEIYYSVPPLTSASCGSSGFADSVSDAVMRCLHEGLTEGEHLVEPRLILSESCGCSTCTPPADHIHTFNDRFYRYQDDNQILAETGERMQTAEDFASASYTLFQDVIHDMTCILNSSCTDDTVNYFETKRESAFDDEMLMFFDTELKPFRQYRMSRREIVPLLGTHIRSGYPLIFVALSFMNVPLGYLCFHFHDYEITDYCKVPQLVTGLNTALGGFMNRRYQLYLLRRIEQMYRYDSLTGLLNRLSFAKSFAELKQMHGHEEMPLTVILSDLDGLKPINDHFGHAAGDNAIHTAAVALQAACPAGSLCVRFGGDEMVAVIPGQSEAEEIISRIHGYLEEYNTRSGLQYRITTSIGFFTTVLREDTDFETLVRESDAVMYLEKQRKKQKS